MTILNFITGNTREEDGWRRAEKFKYGGDWSSAEKTGEVVLLDGEGWRS